MHYMFYGCNSLISLNINNFDTSSVTSFACMFNGLSSLISLNIKSFSTSLLENDNSNMFDNINNNLILCFNETTLSQGIKDQLTQFINNCTDDCFINRVHKIIDTKYQCIDDCSKDNIYGFEYDNICYDKCPNGTHSSLENKHKCVENFICNNYYNYNYTGCLDEIPLGYYLNNSILKTIDKCDIKCSNCSLESMLNDLCISCNINESYYPKYNDSSNNNSFINCYNYEFERYYLDKEEKIYKSCYYLCKNC